MITSKSEAWLSRLRCLVVFAALLLVGCGSDTNEFIATGGAVNPSTPRLLYGKFNLGGAISNAAVILTDASGNTILGQTTTDATGAFSFSGANWPPDLRVRATLGDGLDFYTEVRGFTGTGRQTTVNVPTTLVSLYARKNGVSVAQADTAVHNYLAIPMTNSLEGVEESFRSPFSHLAFFVVAAQRGGWTAFSSEALNLIDQTAAPTTKGALRGRFRLKPSLLQASLNGLERGRVRPKSSLLQASLIGLEPELATSIPPYTVNDGTTGTDYSPYQYMAMTLEGLPDDQFTIFEPVPPPSTSTQAVRGKLMTDIESALTSVGVNQVLGDSWTHIADAYHLNYGTADMLQNIENQLDEVIADISHLEQQIDQVALSVLFGNLNGDVADINDIVAALVAPNPSTDLANPNTVLLAPNEDVEALEQAFKGFAIDTSLTAIQQQLNGTYLQTTVNDTIYNTTFGIQDISGYGNTPFLSQGIQTEILTAFNYYAQAQQSACNAIAENAHIVSEDPVDAMIDALNTIQGAVAPLKDQRGQLPWAVRSNNLIIDKQAGLTWCATLQAPTTYDNAANNIAPTFQVDAGNGLIYTGWRLPTTEETRFLQDRARLVATSKRDPSIPNDGSTSSYGNYGYTTQGLPALGFDPVTCQAYLNSDGDILTSYYSKSGESGSGNGSWSLQKRYSEMNHQNSDFNQTYKNGNYPFFLVRSIGPTPLLVPDFTEDKNQYLPPLTGQELGPEEFPMLGHVTGISGVRQVNGFMGATLTYSLNVGGSFSMGTGNDTSYDLPSASYSQTVDSYSGGDYNFSAPYDLQEVIDYQSADDSIVSIGVTGQALWHVTSTAPQTVGVTATVRSTNGTQYSATGTVDSPTAKQLVSVQIFPRNVLMQSDTGKNMGAEQTFYLVGFYNDNTIADLTSSATWSIDSSAPQLSITGSTVDFKLDNSQTNNISFNISAILNGTAFNDSTALVAQRL